MTSISLADRYHNEYVLAEAKFLAKAGVSQALFDRTQKENDTGVYDVFLPGPTEFKKYGIRNVSGIQNLDSFKSFKAIYQNGPDDNNAEELMQTLRVEYSEATDQRKDQIRASLKLLNERFPPKQTLRLGVVTSAIK